MPRHTRDKRYVKYIRYIYRHGLQYYKLFEFTLFFLGDKKTDAGTWRIQLLKSGFRKNVNSNQSRIAKIQSEIRDSEFLKSSENNFLQEINTLTGKTFNKIV